MPYYTCEYTHNGVRGLLSCAPSTDELAKMGFAGTVRAMSGAKKELHDDTFEEHENVKAANAFATQWAIDAKRPKPSPEQVKANADRVFGGQHPADKAEAEDD